MRGRKDQQRKPNQKLSRADRTKNRDMKIGAADSRMPETHTHDGRVSERESGHAKHPTSAKTGEKPAYRDRMPTEIVTTAEKPRHRSGTPLVGSKTHKSARTAESVPFAPHLGETGNLNSPDWIHVGKYLQHPEHQGEETEKILSVRIGLDFGTAFTKVAILADEDLVYVDWSAVINNESPVVSLLMPGKVVRTKEGIYCWRQCPVSDIRTNLKLPLIELTDFENCPVDTLAYLALVIRYARAYLYLHSGLGPKLATHSLLWEMNIGCPTKPQVDPESNPNIKNVFYRVATTAWSLAAEDDLRKDTIVTTWKDDHSNRTFPGLETEPLVVPEFVAQIAGYLNSPQLTEGLHALIDIGAATLDIATFIVEKPRSDSNPSISIIFSRVEHLGTHYLSENRCSQLELKPEWDDALPIEPTVRLATRCGKSQTDIQRVDRDFGMRVVDCIVQLINGTRENKIARSPKNEPWVKGLPVFITGGGSLSSLYRHAIYTSKEKIRKKICSSSQFRFRELSPLGETKPNSRLSRMTVAIGLTSDEETIVRVAPRPGTDPDPDPPFDPPDHTQFYSD